eukprot:1156372-Pelagomonas_calceolata.AAC.11
MLSTSEQTHVSEVHAFPALVIPILHIALDFASSRKGLGPARLLDLTGSLAQRFPLIHFRRGACLAACHRWSCLTYLVQLAAGPSYTNSSHCSGLCFVNERVSCASNRKVSTLGCQPPIQRPVYQSTTSQSPKICDVALGCSSCEAVSRGYKGYKVGLQPETLADRLLVKQAQPASNSETSSDINLKNLIES